MKPLILLFFAIFLSLQCNSQSMEVTLYLKKEWTKQRDAHIIKAKELQRRIDSLDQQLGNKKQTGTLYLTKTTGNAPTNTYSNSLKSNYKRKTYTSRSTRTYYRGPRGGCYYINSKGNKSYVSRSMCD